MLQKIFHHSVFLPILAPLLVSCLFFAPSSAYADDTTTIGPDGVLEISVTGGTEGIGSTASDEGNPTSKSLVPCGNKIGISTDAGGTTYTNECTICHLQQLAQRLLNFFILISLAIAALLFANAGFLYVTSPANPGNIARAHKMFTSTLIGLVLILAAYLLIDVVMKTLLAGGLGDVNSYGPWNTILCEGFSNSYTVDPLGTITLNPMELVLKVGGGSDLYDQRRIAGSEVLPPLDPNGLPQSGNCSVGFLDDFFSADQVATASCVCQHESSGVSSIGSGVDKCQPSGESVSWGLFQINLTAHDINGLDCTGAVSGGPYTASDHTCSVTNSLLWEQCKQAAKNATLNVQKAVEIQRSGGWSQWGAYRHCH